MKKDTHPKYQLVLFIDSATGKKFLCGSTLQPKATEKYEGSEYPVYHLPISSYSHPFFTGSSQLVDAEGRVEKFKNKYAAAAKQKKEAAAKKAEPVKAAKKTKK
jgi:large subunit ribosomal protein L31